MADMMTFPNTVEEFMEQYKITDIEQIYTNGAELVPIFRMKQWFDHKQDIVHCKDCKYWRRQTNYAGAPLSFGFCESDDMWRLLYGETYEVSHIDTDDDFYCGFAERREGWIF